MQGYLNLYMFDNGAYIERYDGKVFQVLDNGRKVGMGYVKAMNGIVYNYNAYNNAHFRLFVGQFRLF